MSVAWIDFRKAFDLVPQRNGDSEGYPGPAVDQTATQVGDSPVEDGYHGANNPWSQRGPPRQL